MGITGEGRQALEAGGWRRANPEGTGPRYRRAIRLVYMATLGTLGQVTSDTGSGTHAMPGSFFYIVRRRPGAVPGTAWVLLDPPPGGEGGVTDGHTIGILMPSAGSDTDGAEALLRRLFPERPGIDPPRTSKERPDTHH